MTHEELLERGEAPVNVFDRDMSEVEHLADPLDRGRQTLETYLEAVGKQESPFYGKVPRGRWASDRPIDWGEHFALPTMQGAGLGTIRPLEFEDHSWVNRTPEHVFVPIWQETMWRLDVAAGPVAFAGMSECSLLVARNGDDLWVAHNGYNNVETLKQTMAKLKEAGVDPATMVAVVPTEPRLDDVTRQKRANPMLASSELGPRATVADYREYGVTDERIVGYDAYFDQDDKGPLTRNLARVVVRPEEIYVVANDYRRVQRPEGGLTEIVEPEPTMERVVAL